ncbi:hypothetical protein WH299_15960 [Pseudomonas sp. MYb541]|uniref:hypothetical protein n=1 Tax=Pseudomonas sp. MYb541 TaxID=2745402 RepID=UPI0030961BB5
MPVWDLKQLRSSVECLYGRDQKSAIAPSLDSIHQRREFARYHYHEARRLIGDVATSEDSEMQIMQLIMGADEEASAAFQKASFQAAAHITACLQSMHTVADLLSHTLYYAFGMNLDPSKTIEAHKIGIRSVSRNLPEGELKRHLKTLVEHDDFIYLSAITNHSKHRSVVKTNYSLDCTGDSEMPHGLKFSRFEYGGEIYPERWVTPTLESEYKRQAEIVVSVGIALNAALDANI